MLLPNNDKVPFTFVDWAKKFIELDALKTLGSTGSDPTQRGFVMDRVRPTMFFVPAFLIVKKI